MQLQQVTKETLSVFPIDLSDVPARFMNPGELEVLTALVLSGRHKRVIEFGCNVGRTAKVLLRECPDIVEYVGVDVFQDYKPGCIVQAGEIPASPGHMVRDDSRFKLVLKPRGTLDLWPEDLGSADVVFIDGDHSYEVVRHDTILATKILRPGGIIIWHDYHELGTVQVKEVLEELQDMGRKIKHVEGTWLAYERRLP